MRCPDDASTTDLSNAARDEDLPLILDMLRTVAATASRASGVGEGGDELEMLREENGHLRDENRRLRAEVAMLRSLLPGDASPSASDIGGYGRERAGGIEALERKLDWILEHLAANSAVVASLSRGLIEVGGEVVDVQHSVGDIPPMIDLATGNTSSGHSSDWSYVGDNGPNSGREGKADIVVEEAGPEEPTHNSNSGNDGGWPNIDCKVVHTNEAHKETQTDDNENSRPSAKVIHDNIRDIELTKSAPANHLGKGETELDSTVAVPPEDLKLTTEAPPDFCTLDEHKVLQARGDATRSMVVKSTECFGGSGGGPFDDGYEDDEHRGRISKIAVRAGCIIDAIVIMYSENSGTNWHGGHGGGEQGFTLRENEFVTEVSVRYGRFVQCLTFLTNMGRRFGPYGGDGWVKGMFLRGLQSKEAVLKAPDGFMLVGLHGRSGKFLDGIGFHWGPVPSAVREAAAEEDLRV